MSKGPLKLHPSKPKAKSVRRLAGTPIAAQALPHLGSFVVSILYYYPHEIWKPSKATPGYSYPENEPVIDMVVFKIVAPNATQAGDWAVSKLLGRHFGIKINVNLVEIVELNDDLAKEFTELRNAELRSQGYAVD